jgi:hypothetical protein
VLDEVVDTLGAYHVAVVLNNHTTLGKWSGGVEDNGLWFNDNNSSSQAVHVDVDDDTRAAGGGGGAVGGGAGAGSAGVDGGSLNASRGVNSSSSSISSSSSGSSGSSSGDSSIYQKKRRHAGYSEDAWVQDWVLLARRYQNRPWVVGYDLRNEVSKKVTAACILSWFSATGI